MRLEDDKRSLRNDRHDSGNGTPLFGGFSSTDSSFIINAMHTQQAQHRSAPDSAPPRPPVSAPPQHLPPHSHLPVHGIPHTPTRTHRPYPPPRPLSTYENIKAGHPENPECPAPLVSRMRLSQRYFLPKVRARTMDTMPSTISAIATNMNRNTVD